MKVKKSLIPSLILIASLPSAPVMAQVVEEIIVQARKRDESILRVPVVASAFTQESLEKYQTHDLHAVANRVPGFVMGESVGTVGIQASLRGIGPTSQTATVDQSVSLNIDGLALTQGYAFAAGMFDVGQLEVLKGPQALFYGKNSTAGVISLRSADPTDEFEVIVRGGFEFEAEEKLSELIVSGPVSETLKLRLATRFSDAEGYFRNNGSPIPGLGSLPPRHRKFAPQETLIVRGTALFEPNEFYQARLKLNHVDDRIDGSGGDGQVAHCPDGTGGVSPIDIPFLQDSDCRLNRYTQFGDFDPDFWPGIRNKGVPFVDSRQHFGTLEQDFNLTPNLSLTSVTGFYDIKQDNLIRGDGSSTGIIAADFTFKNQQFTQELRLSSDFDSPFNFMVGAFYQDGEMTVYNRLRGNTAFSLPPLLESGRHDIDIQSVSAFGQILWQVTEHIELAAGARWTDEERKHRFRNGLANWEEVNLLTPRINADNLSPEFSITYTPTDSLTLFAAYRQGFKSGSFNTVVSANESTRADFGDEKAEGGEIGLKARFFDNSLAVNLAAYHYRYSDLQAGANDLAESGAILLNTINAASAKVEGIELETVYTPAAVPGLTLHGAVNYNHARYNRFSNAPCGNGQTIAEGCDQLLDLATGRYTSQDLSGRPLVRAPDWTASFGFDYERPIGNDMTLAFGSTTGYSSEYYTNLVAQRDFQQDSYFKTSANIALRGPEDKWEVALIGNNLANRITAGTCANANIQNGVIFGGQLTGGETKGPAGDDEVFCVPERGRELLIRLTWRL